MPRTQSTALQNTQALQALNNVNKVINLSDCLTIKLSLKIISRSDSDNAERQLIPRLAAQHEREKTLILNKDYKDEYMSFPIAEVMEPLCPPPHPLSSSLSAMRNAQQLSQAFSAVGQIAGKILAAGDNLSPLSGSNGFYACVLNGASPSYVSDLEMSEVPVIDL